MRQSRSTIIPAALVFLAVPFLVAGTAAAPDSTMRLASESKLWVEGTSTVQSYTCETNRLDATIDMQSIAVPSSPAELGAAVRQVDLRVPIGALECGNRTMNSHMRNALKVDSHPAVRFRVTRHTVQANGNVRLEGRLTIAGQERPVTIAATAVDQGNGRFRVQGRTELKMTDYGVEPPRLMMGTLRVHDPVVVAFDLILQP